VRDGKPASADDWQIRVPTYTPDIAATAVALAAALAGAPPPGARGAALAPAGLAGVWHYSAGERFTRFALVQLFGELMALPTAHVARLEGAPPGARRPFDCQLDTRKLLDTGLAAPCTPFREAVARVLAAASK